MKFSQMEKWLHDFFMECRCEVKFENKIKQNLAIFWHFFIIFSWKSINRIFQILKYWWLLLIVTSETIILINRLLYLMEALKPHFFRNVQKFENQYFKITSLIKWTLDVRSVEIMKAPSKIWKLVFTNEKCVI